MPPNGDRVFTVPYSIDNLAKICSECTGTPLPWVKEKPHIKYYFNEYFQHFVAQGTVTIVVQKKYTDRDYLEDFAAYYVRCLPKYDSRCYRLHFFNLQFDDAELQKACFKQSVVLNVDSLNENYLGFIVIKPLPERFIGRTCLKTFLHEGHRYYPATRQYEVHLLGFNLCVNSLAFQEQDTVAAACATSALWSIFHGTGKLFHHQIYTPVEITKRATEQIPCLDRDIPNHGLAPLHICSAIKKIGLEAELLTPSTERAFKSVIYAYLKCGIPLLLGAELFDLSVPNKPESKGYHAVAVTGYSMDTAQVSQQSKHDIILTSSNIDKIYVHDDGIGPFARLTFRKMPSMGNIVLDSSWRGINGKMGSVIFVPQWIGLAVYHKIRIRFERPILEYLIKFEAVLELLRNSGLIKSLQKPEWDVFLTTENQLKTDLLTSAL